MSKDVAKTASFTVIAKKCVSSVACPTVLDSGNGEEVIVVGRLDAAVLNSPDVQKHVSEGEIAVVIPKNLLKKAARALN